MEQTTSQPKANYSMREIEQMYIAKGWKRANKPAGTGFVTITFRHNPQMKPSETDSDKQAENEAGAESRKENDNG